MSAYTSAVGHAVDQQFTLRRLEQAAANQTSTDKNAGR